MLIKSRLRWAGHIVRMPDHRPPKKLLFGELQEGKRFRSVPNKRFKDSLKASLKTFTIDQNSWEAEAQDRCGWRAAIYEGTKRSEASRTHAAEQRRQAKKESAKSSAAATLPCPHCPSKQGSASHVTFVSTLQINTLPHGDETMFFVVTDGRATAKKVSLFSLHLHSSLFSLSEEPYRVRS